MQRTRSTVLATAALGGLLVLGVTAATAGPSTSQRVAPGFEQDRSAELASQIDPSVPRNVILIIGDGMDDSMITAARDYQLGADGRFALDDLPFTGAMTTHGLKVGAGPDYPIAYVSDSAPTASAWSTGKKTVDGRVSQGPSTAASVPGVDYETVLEKYHDLGKLTGNVSTAEITDATPAAAASHINARACQGPTDMAACTAAKKSNGGKGSIAEQLVDNQIDVLLGGGKQRYLQNIDAGGTALDYATTTQGYSLVEDKAALASATLEDGPVLGLFTSGNMTPMNQPLVATPPPGAGGPDTTCSPSNRANEPELSDMMAKSLELLDNPEGFFLQIESAMIDKQEHASDICGAIGDLVELDEVVQQAVDFQTANPDTLIIVTGDHAHSTQIVGNPADDGRQTATLKTADGDPLSVAYSTNAVGSDHTGAQIRVAASGPQASNVTGVIDQTDLFQTLLGRTPSELPGPGEPAALRPQVGVAAAGIDQATIRQRGLRVSVASAGTTSVSLKVIQSGTTLKTVAVPASGSVVTKVKRATAGRLKLVVTGTGPGGTDRAQTSVRVTKK